MLTPEQQTQVRQNLQKLDYLKGTGVLATHRRRLAEERFLFISSGGNGHKTLCALRRQLEWKVEPEELRTKVRYLAVDAAHTELDLLTEDSKADPLFAPDEVLKLPFEGAHDSIAPDRISPQMAEWVDPKLYDETGGMAKANPALSGFDASGAGAWRQPGRVRLCQPITIRALEKALNKAITELSENSPKGLKIFFLGGIAGGTGSGTLIDLAFMTRQIVKNVNPALYANTGVSAYLLLPSACSDGKPLESAAKSKGNRNAYAALKEIDYFMGLTQRKEAFRQKYDTFDVDITENIFDFCTLVEGASGATRFGDPGETARHVTANSILNLIAVPEAKPGGGPFLVDSFLSNKVNIQTAIQQQSHKKFPRNANYCYNVIGYSSCVVPIDLITLTVANRVFERVFKVFNKCAEAGEKEAQSFLDDCYLDPRSVCNAASDKVLEERVKAQADDRFRRKGPYYMINLLKEAARQINQPGQFRSVAAQRSSGLFGRQKQNWVRAEQRYARLERLMTEMNIQLYEVYTFVIRELQGLLERNGKLLTDVTERNSCFGNSFCWSPVDLTSGEQASKTVKKYLESLLPQEEIGKKAQAFVDMLCDNKDKWTKLAPKTAGGTIPFAVAEDIRDFIQREFKNCVDTTMDNFLMKCFGNADSQVPTLDEKADPEGHKALRKVAERIVNELGGKANALVATGTGFNLETSCISHTYMTVPDACSKYLKKYIAGVDNTMAVYGSSAMDEIVFYRLYIGVPAWAIDWVGKAEKDDYEPNPDQQVGLHMEHGKNGRDWTRFPNLFVEKCWGEGDADARRREKKLLDEARSDLEKARDLGLARVIDPNKVGTGLEEYEVLVWGKGVEPTDDLLPLLELAPGKHPTMAEALDILVEKGILVPHSLHQVGMVWETTESPVPKDFGWELSCGSLRRMMAVWDALKTVLAPAETLKTTLEQGAQEGKRRRTYLDSLANGLLHYDALRKMWYIELGDETALGARLNEKLQQECKEYFGAQQFFQLSEETYEQFVERLNELQGEEAKVEDLQKAADNAKALRERLSALRNLRTKSDDVSFPMASRYFEEEAGEDTETIRAFYDWMINNL